MSSGKSDTDREAKLAQALRANLRRRKAPRPAPPREAKGTDPAAPESGKGD
ncbi:MAG: hypothetical protein WDA06_08825 [Phenylobacterium sp.]|jgi:hypothetical protein